MNHPTDSFIPQNLLLATDMCQRCDRPLDRAKQLASEWQANITILTVRDGPGTPDEVASWLDGSAAVPAFELAARAEIAQEFADSDVLATLQVVRGDVSEAILQAAGRLSSALVIIGASREESFQQLLLGSTAARLVQELAQPLLVVRQRTRGSYARILVANDLGAAARRALDTALGLFPGRRITLMHVLQDKPTASLAATAGALREASENSERFLDTCDVEPAVRANIDIAIGHGSVADAITRHVQAGSTQLVVLGVHQHSTLARVFKGAISDELLRHLPCDTLLVRTTQGSADD